MIRWVPAIISCSPKIALGSGGVFGKGFLKGTQSHLNFLPEKHTDFIFTMLSEEFGLIGGVVIILVNMLILAYSYAFAMRTTSYFGKLLIIGWPPIIFFTFSSILRWCWDCCRWSECRCR